MANVYNTGERIFFGMLLKLFHKPAFISTIQWAMKYRKISNRESSFGVGNFDPDLTPYMEYVYECLDNPYIPVICSRKSSRIAWTETINNYRGRRMHNDPTTMLLGFATKDASKNFAKNRWQDFLSGVPVLNDIVNVGIAANKKSIFEYLFPNGLLRMATLGSIVNLKSDNFPYIEIEEPDDAKDDVGKQGDTFQNLIGRQKTVPLVRRKFIFGGTPTNKDFSRVDAAILKSNQLVFKACCHNCNSLIPMDGSGFNNIKYGEYPNRYIDSVFGTSDPNSAVFICPECKVEWSFEQKNLNIKEGKKYGFVDHTGNFSKGWHPNKPDITEIYGFIFSELMSPFPASSFVELMKAYILAKIELDKGNEGLMKSFTNNSKGEAYASGITALDADEMVLLRSNYPEHICPMEGLILTAGIDVQINRFAIIIRAWGRNGNSWLVTWKEIWGDVTNIDDPVWGRLTAETVLAQIPHASGKMMNISAVSIDSAALTENVYRWVLEMQEHNSCVYACKGAKELKKTDDPIYSEPTVFEADSDKKTRKSLAENMGVTVYQVGAHQAHIEILNRVQLRKKQVEQGIDIKSNVYYFNEQTYGQYEAQMTSCRKVLEHRRDGTLMEVMRLIPGKRKEAIDAEKMALQANRAIGLHNAEDAFWTELERHYYS